MKKKTKKIATMIVIVLITFMSACAPSKKSVKAPTQHAPIAEVKNNDTLYSALTLRDLEGLTPEQIKGLQVYISHPVTMSRTEAYKAKEIKNGVLYWIDTSRLVTKSIDALTKGQIILIKNPGSASIELAVSFDKDDKSLTLKFYNPNDVAGNLVLVMSDDRIAIREGYRYEVNTTATSTDQCKLLFVGKGKQGSSSISSTAKGNPVGNTVIPITSPNPNSKIILPAKPVRDSM